MPTHRPSWPISIQKLGKKDEARNIFYSAAETLYARGSYAAAEEALGKVLTLDPDQHRRADAARVDFRGSRGQPGRDYLPGAGHRTWIRGLTAYALCCAPSCRSGNADGVEAVAEKLLDLHKDSTGVTTLAQWYATNNQVENALRLYETHAERLFAGNHAALQDALNPLAARVRENPAALAILNRLMNSQASRSTMPRMRRPLRCRRMRRPKG